MTQQHLLCAQVTAPPIPDWLLELADQTLLDDQAKPNHWGVWDQANPENKKIDRMLLTRLGKTSKNGVNKYYYLDNKCVDWAKQNIDANIFDMRITTTDPGCQHKGPHKDLSRQWTGIYVLKSGGPENQTCWYKDKNLPGLDCPAGHVVTDYDQVDTICCVRLIPYQWYLLNSNILHGVENINQGRKTLQFSLNDISTLSLFNTITTQFDQ